MSKVRVLSFATSIDGFGAGPNQSLEHPLGVMGSALMEWFFQTRVGREIQGKPGGDTGVDNQMAFEGFSGVGAWIIGRNMFGAVRGPWLDESWRGWWGEEPPFHLPVFVLTHHARRPLPMLGGTTFHFVTSGFLSALEKAKRAARGKDIRVGGGPVTIRQFLVAGLIDSLHLAMRPVVMGKGESLSAGLDLRALGYTCTDVVAGERATHVMMQRRSP